MMDSDDLSCALTGNTVTVTLYQQDREFMLAKRANESFDSLVRLIGPSRGREAVTVINLRLFFL